MFIPPKFWRELDPEAKRVATPIPIVTVTGWNVPLPVTSSTDPWLRQDVRTVVLFLIICPFNIFNCEMALCSTSPHPIWVSYNQVGMGKKLHSTRGTVALNLSIKLICGWTVWFFDVLGCPIIFFCGKSRVFLAFPWPSQCVFFTAEGWP